MINSVRTELEAHPAWQAKQAQIAINLADEKADYEAKIKSGWCPKCGTWCHGECGL